VCRRQPTLCPRIQAQCSGGAWPGIIADRGAVAWASALHKRKRDRFAHRIQQRIDLVVIVVAKWHAIFRTTLLLSMIVLGTQRQADVQRR
jgi:hypothetical protein